MVVDSLVRPKIDSEDAKNQLIVKDAVETEDVFELSNVRNASTENVRQPQFEAVLQREPKQTKRMTMLKEGMKKIRDRTHPGYYTTPRIVANLIFGIPVYLVSFIDYLFKTLMWFLALVVTGIKSARADGGINLDIPTMRTLMNITLTYDPTIIQKHDFIKHRAGTYLWASTMELGSRMMDWLSGTAYFKPLGDDELQAMLFCSCISRDFIKESDIPEHDSTVALARAKSSQWEINWESRVLTLFHGYYMDVEGVLFDKDTGELALKLRKRENSGDCSGFDNVSIDDTKGQYIVRCAENNSAWETAKAHMSGLYGYWVPAMTHNWVHFHYSDLSAKNMLLTIPKETILGTVLHTHLRFTSFINTRGPNMTTHMPASVRGSTMDFLRLWKAFPVGGEQFITNVLVNTQRHYIDFGTEEQEVFQDNPTDWSTEKAFPPMFVKRRLPGFAEYDETCLGVVPYLDMQAEYYSAVYQFVYDLDQNNLLEMDILRNWRMAMNETGLPKFMRVNHVEALAILIWTSSIVHCTDHNNQNHFSNASYLTTVVPFKVDGEAEEILHPAAFSLGQWQHAKSRTFFQRFVSYRRSWFGLDDRILADGLYEDWGGAVDRKRAKCDAIADKFHQNLHALNERWGWIVDLENIAASTCY